MSKCAVLINSADKSDFTWKGLKYFYNKYWNWDIGWNVYCATEEREYDFGKVKNIQAGKVPWGQFIHNCLDQLDEPYVFFQMDDHWPLQILETSLLETSLQYIQDYNIIRFGFMFCYHPLMKPDRNLGEFCGYPFWGLTKQSDYLSCFQPSIWNKEVFRDIIESQWTPWNGEIDGTIKMRRLDLTNICYIIKENWYREAYTKNKGQITERHEDCVMFRREFDF